MQNIISLSSHIHHTRDCLVLIVCYMAMQRFRDNATLNIIVFNNNNNTFGWREKVEERLGLHGLDDGAFGSWVSAMLLHFLHFLLRHVHARLPVNSTPTNTHSLTQLTFHVPLDNKLDH